MALEPGRNCWNTQSFVRYSKGIDLNFVTFRVKYVTVVFQEYDRGRHSRSFISVDERVIGDDGVRVRRSLIEERREKLGSKSGLLRSHHCTLEAIPIPDSVEPTGFVHHKRVDFHHLQQA